MLYPTEEELRKEAAYLQYRKETEENQQWYEECERSQKPAKIEVVLEKKEVHNDK